jgi:hypothetical protein
MVAPLAASLVALVAPGLGASATYAGGALTLTLRYEMTCAQPGPGPLTVQLPQSWRLGDVTVAGRRSTTAGHTVTIAIPGPKGVTCMSIAPGTLRVRISGVHAPPGTYTVRAQIRRFTFSPRVHVG